MPKRANHEGNIKHRADGRWEIRVVVGIDGGAGKPIRKSRYFKTQAEARKALSSTSTALDEGTYIAPSKLKMDKWLDTWLAEYTHNIKPYSLRSYKSQVERLKRYIGAIKVKDLTPDIIQRMYNRILDEEHLSPKTLKNIHGILHSSMETLVDIGERRDNPCAACVKRLPKVIKKELHPLADDDLTRFMQTIAGDSLENLYLIDLFTGLRQGELLGLCWSCIDFTCGAVTVNKQLYMPDKGGEYTLETLKNRKSRTLCVPDFVLDLFKKERKKQLSARLAAGEAWNTGAFPDLVFTNERGGHLCHKTVYKRFKAAVAKSSVPSVRFHDMRHSYAVASLRCGDDPKTVQENLGHASAAFTLDQYAFVTERMKQESANRMQNYINSLTAL